MSFGKFFLKKAGLGVLLAGGALGLGDNFSSLSKCSAANKPISVQTPAELYVWGNGIKTDRSEYLGIYPGFEPVKVIAGGKQAPDFTKFFFAECVLQKCCERNLIVNIIGVGC